MSGTSCDGVSLALCRFEKRRFKILKYKTVSYPKPLAQKLQRALSLKTAQLSELNMELGHFFADAAVRFLRQTKTASQVAVIGSHGHTVYHGPEDKTPNTFQLGEASVIAEKTGIPVVSDFRPRDIAAGGEGAPLVPFFDQYFFARGKSAALQNIGGISNVTFIDSKGKILAFDNGPGNCLMDLTVQKFTRGKKDYDSGGNLAKRGWIKHAALTQMALHPYFLRRPPKSTGRELFNEAFVEKHLKNLKTLDRLATLNFFTAYIIHQSYKRFLPALPSEVIVSGGGAKNKLLMKNLQRLFGRIPVRSAEDLGIPAQAKEPAAFAFFAWQAFHKKINHAPSGTGAKHARILGKIIY